MNARNMPCRHCRQDQAELEHLQRHGDGPIDVVVQDEIGAELDQEPAHVEPVVVVLCVVDDVDENEEEQRGEKHDEN